MSQPDLQPLSRLLAHNQLTLDVAELVDAIESDEVIVIDAAWEQVEAPIDLIWALLRELGAAPTAALAQAIDQFRLAWHGLTRSIEHWDLTRAADRDADLARSDLYQAALIYGACLMGLRAAVSA